MPGLSDPDPMPPAKAMVCAAHSVILVVGASLEDHPGTGFHDWLHWPRLRDGARLPMPLGLSPRPGALAEAWGARQGLGLSPRSGVLACRCPWGLAKAWGSRQGLGCSPRPGALACQCHWGLSPRPDLAGSTAHAHRALAKAWPWGSRQPMSLGLLPRPRHCGARLPMPLGLSPGPGP